MEVERSKVCSWWGLGVLEGMPTEGIRQSWTPPPPLSTHFSEATPFLTMKRAWGPMLNST